WHADVIARVEVVLDYAVGGIGDFELLVDLFGRVFAIGIRRTQHQLIALEVGEKRRAPALHRRILRVIALAVARALFIGRAGRRGALIVVLRVHHHRRPQLFQVAEAGGDAGRFTGLREDRKTGSQRELR